MTDQTIMTSFIQLVENYPIQIGFVAFFLAWGIGLIRQELSKY